jgi:hypothetical protein
MNTDAKYVLLLAMADPAAPPWLLRIFALSAGIDEPLPSLVRRWLELTREAYDPAAREACAREQDRLRAAMDDEDRESLEPYLLAFRRMARGPETFEWLRQVVTWLNRVLEEHGMRLH